MKQTIKATALQGKGFTIGNAVASIGVQNPLLARGELFYTAKQYCYQQLSGFLETILLTAVKAVSTILAKD